MTGGHDKYNNLCMQLDSSLFASHVLGTGLSIQNETKGTLSISYLLRKIWINIEMCANRILTKKDGEMAQQCVLFLQRTHKISSQHLYWAAHNYW